MQKVLIGIVTLLIAAAIIIKIDGMTSISTTPHQASPLPAPTHKFKPSDVPYNAQLAGEYVCLPHKDTNGPQTLECALGMKLDDGSYISLDFGERLQTGEGMNFGTGERIRVYGLFVPIEQISTDFWQKYPITGILKVETVSKN